MANNVLVLMSDEHTRSVMGAYGNALAQTPALDRLAATGVRFTNAYTPSPICIPARASFATGSAGFEHRCWSSAEPYHGQQRSWMHRLRERGHEVTSIGKLHYRSAADDVGFSESLLPMYLANNGRGWPQGLQRKPMGEFAQTRELAARLGPAETSYTRYDRDITRAAVDWLRRRPANASTKPWVLFVSYIWRISRFSRRNAFSTCTVMSSYRCLAIATRRPGCGTRCSMRCAGSGTTRIISTRTASAWH